MEPDGREALADAFKQILEPLDLQVRIQAALHEDSGTAKFNGLCDLVVDQLAVKHVALFAAFAFDGRVERTEGAVFGAEVRVIDVPIDDVADDAFRMQLAADSVGFHADADEVIGAEHVEGLFASKTHDYVDSSGKQPPEAIPSAISLD